ncbi:cyclic nucleotide-binding domain-containing protein [Magnetofaba australis]|uniref:Putative CRP/FNR family transcriptional regulator n=1 Tax=Magnetofaba australis IT-1 TaxID=1434232 RepID=A0A1Y2JZC8_9PROT|nr:cyclic nucleotide-binding domain-containing protein [Magnetofaba australis]OSM00270.1 putative CRP/FNR family transcriptional regulator [Magnetofaba australis IT-1]
MTSLDVLRCVRLFRDLDNAILDEIATFSEIRSYAHGDAILSESNPPPTRDIYLHLEGSIGVSKRAVVGQTLKDVDIQAIDNEVYGEVGWFLGVAPSADVISHGASNFLVVDGQKLFALCEAHPQVGQQIYFRLASVLAQRLAFNTKNLASKSVIVRDCQEPIS